MRSDFKDVRSLTRAHACLLATSIDGTAVLTTSFTPSVTMSFNSLSARSHVLARWIFPVCVDFSRGLHTHLSLSISIAWFGALTFEARCSKFDTAIVIWSVRWEHASAQRDDHVPRQDQCVGTSTCAIAWSPSAGWIRVQ